MNKAAAARLLCRRRDTSHDGFTLVELLIVLALLAMLSTVAVFSVSGLATSAPGLAAQASALDETLRCDAARGDMLAVDGCPPPPAPALLPPPDLGPVVTTITLTPSASETTTQRPFDIDVAVFDQADEPYGAEDLDEGAMLRWEVSGVAAQSGTIGPTTLGGATAGRASFTYTQLAGGTDTITVCSFPDGTLPASCADSDAVVTSITHTWVLRPYPLGASVDSGRSIDITWTTALSDASDLGAYAVYDDSGCTGTPRATGDASGGHSFTASRDVIATDSSPPTTTIRLTWGSGPQPFADAGYLSIAAGAETSQGGSANVDIRCIAFGGDPDGPASVTISPTSGSSDVADGDVTFTATVTDSGGEPLSGIQVRWDVDGDSAGGTATTGSAGTATFAYTGQAGTTDTVRACTNSDGTAPSSCPSSGPLVASATWEWTGDDDPEPPPPDPDPPTFSSWTRVNATTIRVVWNGVITSSGPVGNYRVFANPGQCSNNQSALVPTSRSLSVVGSTTEVTLTFPSNTNLPSGNNRRLLILADTEFINGAGNANTGCLGP